MLSVGVDTHLKTHTIEVQNDRRQSVWRGTANNNREGLDRLQTKLKQLERASGPFSIQAASHMYSRHVATGRVGVHRYAMSVGPLAHRNR